MRLETERLILVPLSIEYFKLYLEDRSKMEKNLGVEITGEKTSAEKKKIFQKPYEQAKKDRKNHLWHTHWQVISKDENRIVCGITFKGVPNNKGEVEIGYGTRVGFQNRGYMTETVKKLSQWALTQKDVKWVVAETNIDNIASQKVLEKSGFERFKIDSESYWYKIAKSVNVD